MTLSLKVSLVWSESWRGMGLQSWGLSSLCLLLALMNSFLLERSCPTLFSHCPPYPISQFSFIFSRIASRFSPCGCILRIYSVFFRRDYSEFSSVLFLALLIFWILEEMELIDRLNCVASFLRTEWLKMTLELMSCSRMSVSSLVHPLRLSLELIVLELSLLISSACSEQSWWSSFLKKERVNLELYFQISLTKSLKDFIQKSQRDVTRSMPGPFSFLQLFIIFLAPFSNSWKKWVCWETMAKLSKCSQKVWEMVLLTLRACMVR